MNLKAIVLVSTWDGVGVKFCTMVLLQLVLSIRWHVKRSSASFLLTELVGSQCKIFFVLVRILARKVVSDFGSVNAALV